MRRSLHLVLCLCFVTTGLTLVALARDVTRSPIPLSQATDDGAANVALVRRFYAAAARVLTTGDAALLDPAIASDLTEHPARPGAASGRDRFVRALLALRATFPGLTLVVDDVRAAGEDLVLVRVHTEGAESGTFLGRSAPASMGQWGPLEVWRLANGQLVERWGELEPAALLSTGQVPVSVDTLGSGQRRVTLTRMTVEPWGTLRVANGQAIRVFAVDAGRLTVEVEAGLGRTVAVARGSAVPAVGRPGDSIAAMVGDRVVTTPEAHYTLANDGPIPAVIIVVIVSNVLEGDLSLNNSAAASWTVAAMPEALGGGLPSPAGISARILARSVEVEMPAEPILAIGWMHLAAGATLMLPAGDGTLIAAVDAGSVELATSDGSPLTTLAAGKWAVVPESVGSTWQARDGDPIVVLIQIAG